MKWKRGPCEFLSQKTFLIIKDDLDSKDATKKTDGRKAAAKNATRIGTWPPKMKRVVFCTEEPERPKTANLARPSVLDPALVDKLDMSLLSKELLCDSMTRFHQNGKPVSGGTTSSSSSSSLSLLLPSPPSVSRRRQSAVVNIATTTTWPSHDAPVRRQRRSFEQIYEPRIAAGQMEEIDRSRSPAVATMQEFASKRNSDIRKLDDNNNKNSPPKVLSMVKKRNSRSGLSNDLEIFTSTSKTTRSAPEPCKSCGRPDQPERFHSHPKSSHARIKDIPTPMTMKPKPAVPPVPKSIQKPVALNFRSDRNRNKLDEAETKSNPVIPQDHPSDQQSRSSASMKRGPRSVTCYVCGREFGTASFPIHEPKCMEKWERENNSLPPSQRRPKPQKPAVSIEHIDWNAAAWEQSQEQLVPCAKCGRTFLPERLPIHERSCKATPKNNERLATPVNGRSAPLTIPCCVCGRRFGTRSIKIHEPQCNRRWQTQNDANQQDNQVPYRQKSANNAQGSSQSMYPNLSQKKTVTCYICGRDFGSSSIAIHEPQCLKKWHAENDKLSPARRRKEPQKPEVIYIQDSSTGNMVVDQAATVEANWMTHLSQLIPCKHCGRTFNPDRVNIHEKSCKGSR
ncbi:PREDICTED: zinc finger protein 474-like [Cyphomyrmex costatus]|uniref:zinc finger protein 474-like n=1 Tax=Cyphomyrmex costatus TaxID=456900 RepID=UPI00085237B5|nr:PREDICTED: zinc finger protein 474-like [Cyphomyrmex costatus]